MLTKVTNVSEPKQPDPGPGYCLLKPGEPLTGAYLYLGSQWDDKACTSNLIYEKYWPVFGVFYRKPISDADQAFQSWYHGIMWTTSEPIVHAEAAWKAAKELYSGDHHA